MIIYKKRKVCLRNQYLDLSGKLNYFSLMTSKRKKKEPKQSENEFSLIFPKIVSNVSETNFDLFVYFLFL